MRPHLQGKCDRALQLHDKGLSNTIIAERLGTTAQRVPQMLNTARAKRDKQKAKEAAGIE